MDAHELMTQLQKTHKYARLGDALLERVCAQQLERHPRPKEALKAAKNQLHIMYGAFYPDGCHQRAADIISGLEAGRGGALRDASLALLALHMSTRERLPAAERFYAHIARFAPRAKHVLDVGCGFAPFALPFMDIVEDTIYSAWDLSFATVELINRFFMVCGMPPGARVGDAQALLASRGLTEGMSEAAVRTPEALTRTPLVAADTSFADLALMLKLVPLLEQQRKGLAFELLDIVPARLMAVSFPIKSLGGRNKSMLDHYSRMLESGLSDPSRILDKTVIGDELVYIIAGNVK